MGFFSRWVEGLKNTKKSFSEKFGARNMRRFVEREIEDRLAELIISSTETRLLGVHYSIRDGELICLSI